MRRIFLFIVMGAVVVSLAGCKSISVGGRGDVGGIHGSGGVSIPLPK